MKLAGGSCCVNQVHSFKLFFLLFLASGCPSIKSASLDVTHVISCVTPNFHYVPLSLATNKEARMA